MRIAEETEPLFDAQQIAEVTSEVLEKCAGSDESQLSGALFDAVWASRLANWLRGPRCEPTASRCRR